MMEDHFLLHICLLISTTLVHPFPTLHACMHVPTSSAMHAMIPRPLLVPNIWDLA
jgi:hypothetical protein